jgi:hypothetical protein
VTMEWSYALNKYIEVSERKALPAPESKEEPTTPQADTTMVEEVTAPPVPFRNLFKDEQTTYQTKLLGYALAEAKRKQLSFADHIPPAKRISFLELSGINNLEDVCLMDVEEISDLVNELPEAATLLIMDLLYELYNKSRASSNDSQQKAA